MKVFKFKSRCLFLSSFIGMALAANCAFADVVVIVSANSGVGSLSQDQVGQIFLGKRNAFPNGETAVPVDQGDDTVKGEFYDKVTGKGSAQLKSYWSQMVFTGKAKPPKVLSDNSEVKKLVANNPNIIGYIAADAVDDTVKVVLTP